MFINRETAENGSTSLVQGGVICVIVVLALLVGTTVDSPKNKAIILLIRRSEAGLVISLVAVRSALAGTVALKNVVVIILLLIILVFLFLFLIILVFFNIVVVVSILILILVNVIVAVIVLFILFLFGLFFGFLAQATNGKLLLEGVINGEPVLVGCLFLTDPVIFERGITGKPVEAR